ncbi:BON domain-containing protein [Rhodopila sp.]|jgi:osmotically-inducible protein OsmY|uniref:BON domain-containing protein n=1 Tax=Rhodopila sp. TaxID=2480087 RepID=UPI002BF11A07|nr:BON domain-containing protein [Rhodopila sp.]HVZ10229.1 BON domain-containing protein [Rhodopila sp.]
MDDSALQHAVAEELEWAPHLDAERITVQVHDGVVHLSGIVRSLAEKKIANRTIWHLRGVVGVRDSLAVQPPAQPSDLELASRAARLLAWDSLIPAHAIAASAASGVITLTGTVDGPHLRSVAEERVHQLEGVVGIENRIEVRARPGVAAELRDRVLRAFARHSELDAGAVVVEVDGNRVTLSGTVPSFVQRRIAETAAWAAPGVADVVDHMKVHRPADRPAGS